MPHPLVHRTCELCPFPEALSRVLTAIEDERSTSTTIAQAISADAPLTAALMKLANSAAYRRTKPVGDLYEAVVSVGLSELRVMVTAMAVLSSVESVHETARTLNDLCTVSGSIASGICGRSFDVSPGSAFLSGLLCEIGALALFRVEGDGYASLWEEAYRDHARWSPLGLARRSQLEEERYGVSSLTLGGEILAHNNMPEAIAEAISSGAGLGELAPVLLRATYFARLSPWLAQHAVRTHATSTAELVAFATLAEEAPVTELRPDRLRELCVGAFRMHARVD